MLFLLAHVDAKALKCQQSKRNKLNTRREKTYDSKELRGLTNHAYVHGQKNTISIQLIEFRATDYIIYITSYFLSSKKPYVQRPKYP